MFREFGEGMSQYVEVEIGKREEERGWEFRAFEEE